MAKPTLHELVVVKASLQADKSAAEATLNGIKAQLEELDAEIMQFLDDLGMREASDDVMSVYISEQVVPTVTDWDLAHNFILEGNHMYLLERRMSARPWRELEESGIHVPGTEPFTKRTLRRRSK